MPANQTTGLSERTVEKLLDAAFDDTRWGDAFRVMDSLCGLNEGQFTALETDADGAVVATFAACYINGDPHEEIVRDWAENFAENSENVPRIGRLPAWALTHNEALFTRSEKRSSVMLIRRPYGLLLIVHVHPIPPSRADFGAERLAILVFIRDPDARQFDLEIVGDALGLTAAESRVAVLLGRGRSVREIARELNRSETLSGGH